MTTSNKRRANKRNWKKAQASIAAGFQDRVEEYTRAPAKCANCNSALSYDKRNNKFCGKSCSASFNNRARAPRTDESKAKTQEALLLFRTTCSKRFNTCQQCGTEFEVNCRTAKRKYCSDECRRVVLRKWGQITGRKNAANRPKRSKNEKMFAELCTEHFNNVKTNEPMFNGWDADIVIEDIKVAVLWNGKWHYEKITEKHSLKQVQTRDKIKVEEIKRAGYSPYIVKDMGSFNPTFVQEQFEIFLGHIA